MSAINDNALSKFVGILEIAPSATPTVFTRLASVRGLVANVDTTSNQVEVKADDTNTVFKGYTPEARIEGEFLENCDRDIVDMLLGGTPADVAASPVAGAVQTLASGGWLFNNFYVIENQMGDGTAPTINSVTGGTDGALTDGDGYHLGKNQAGEWGIWLADAASELTIEGQAIVINYDYTPNATESLVVDINFQESEKFVARITVTEGANTRVITLSEATFEGVYGFSFLDVVQNGDLQGTQFVLKANEGSTITYANQLI